MYTTNIDLAPLETLHLLRHLVTDNGKPNLEDCKNAVDHIRANAVAREFVHMLILSRKRVSVELERISKEIWS